MLDQDSARALLQVANEGGATIALVGDRAQLPAVGRGGVLDIASHLAPAIADMTSLHRFTDDTYAALTLELRHGRNPAAIFDQLSASSLIKLHECDEDTYEHIAKTTNIEDAITTATNDEARALNERIRAERVERGEVDDTRTVFGSDGLPIGTGDVIQTRCNDSELGIANRQTWTVQHVSDDGALSIVETVNGRREQRTVTLPAEYVMADVNLAYAATAYGVQGATLDTAHTLLSDTLDAAGVYVGMTRGRERNTLHIVASGLHDAKQQFTEALSRDRADRGLENATERARESIAGLVANGPMSIVNAERERITARIEKAEREREHWASALAKLRDQSEKHKIEYESQRELAEAAEVNAAAVLAKVLEPLVQEATEDGAAFLAAQQAAFEVYRAKNASSRLRKRSVTRLAKEAETHRYEVEQSLYDRWKSIPRNETGLHQWAEAVTQREADQALEVSEAQAEATQARRAASEIASRQSQERTALYQRVLGDRRASAVTARIERLRERLMSDHRYLARLDALPPREAVQLIREHAAKAEAQRFATTKAYQAAKARRVSHVRDFESQRHGPGRDHRPGL